MQPTTPPNNTTDTPEQPCSRCPHSPANANIGQQIMQHIAQLTPTERIQMRGLIDGILAASLQQRPPKRPTQSKRGKKR